MKLGFTNIWVGFDLKRNYDELNVQYYVKIFEDLGFDVEVVDAAQNECDVLFEGVWGNERVKGTPRICFECSGECWKWNKHKYSISFNPDNSTNCYFPNYFYYKDLIKKTISHNVPEYPEQRKFCSAVISDNKRRAKRRRQLFKLVNTYKTMDSAGKWKNNIGGRLGNYGDIDQKIEFLKNYKFHFAVENISQDWYLTEKIFTAYAGGSVPIYYGDTKEIKNIFKKGTYIDCNNKSLFQIRRLIKKIDQNDDLYLEMINQKPVINEDYFEDRFIALENFIKGVLVKEKFLN